MKVRQLPKEEWAHFLEEFSRDHRGWLATVEREHHAGVAHDVRKCPLVAIHATHQAGGEDIVVLLHPPEEPLNTIRIAHATALRVLETDAGAAQDLDVTAEDGERLNLRLGGVTFAGTLLDGLAPGELS